MEAGQVPRVLMHVHLGRLEVVELLADHGLVARRQPGPRLVGAPVILVGLRHLYVVVEVNHLPANKGKLSLQSSKQAERAFI